MRQNRRIPDWFYMKARTSKREELEAGQARYMVKVASLSFFR
ncbi:hypothetical protein [Aneurinibacillus aneurinilyticus]